MSDEVTTETPAVEPAPAAETTPAAKAVETPTELSDEDLLNKSHADNVIASFQEKYFAEEAKADEATEPAPDETQPQETPPKDEASPAVAEPTTPKVPDEYVAAFNQTMLEQQKAKDALAEATKTKQELETLRGQVQGAIDGGDPSKALGFLGFTVEDLVRHSVAGEQTDVEKAVAKAVEARDKQWEQRVGKIETFQTEQTQNAQQWQHKQQADQYRGKILERFGAVKAELPHLASYDPSEVVDDVVNRTLQHWETTKNTIQGPQILDIGKALQDIHDQAKTYHMGIFRNDPGLVATIEAELKVQTEAGTSGVQSAPTNGQPKSSAPTLTNPASQDHGNSEPDYLDRNEEEARTNRAIRKIIAAQQS